MSGEPVIRAEGLSKSFAGQKAVDGVSFAVMPAEIFVILGGSGCGKSTLLRLLAGLEYPDTGAIYLDGVDITAVPPYERPLNMMFQSYALFPHMTVAENIGFGRWPQRGGWIDFGALAAAARAQLATLGLDDLDPANDAATN